MPNNITHKKSTTAGAVPTHAQLTQGELVINAADGKVYTKKVDNTVVDLTDTVLLDGGAQFTPLDIANTALWLDAADVNTLYTTDAGPVTAVSSPLDITGCALWLDGADAATMFNATSGGSPAAAGGAVARWEDKSGNGKHATQGNAGNQPSLQSGVQSGKSVVRFDGAGDHLNTTLADSSQQTFFIVARAFTPTGAQRVFSYAAARSVFASSADMRWWSGNFGSGASSTSFGVAAGVIANNSSFTWFGNGVMGASGDPLDAGISNATIGSESGTLNPLNGDIAEIVVYNTALSAAQRASVEAYLATKWGISGVHRSVAQEIAAVGSPLALTDCALWLDADQSVTPSLFDATVGGSAVTAENGTVARWQDKSGNNRHATQAASANRPLFKNSSYNGRPCLNGSGDRFMVCEGANINASSVTVFAVYRLAEWQPIDNSINPNIYHTDLPASGFTTLGLRSEQGGGTMHVRTGDADSSAPYNLAGITSTHQNQTAIQATRLNGSTGALVSRVSGIQAVSNTVAGTNIPASFGSRVAVMTGFQLTDTGRRLRGDLAEFIIFRRDLSDTDIQRVEKYLATKWGIANVPNPTPPVGYWADKSGNNRHMLQATGANRPATTPTPTNARNTLRWNGSTSRMRTATSAGMGQTMSLFAVVKRGPTVWGGGGAGGYGTILGSGGSNNGPNLMIDNGVLQLTGGTNKSVFTPAGALGVTAPAIFSGTLTSGGTALYVNGALADADPVVGAGSDAGAIEIGAYNPSTQGGGPLAADIAELITYSRVLSAVERQRIEQYLATKWGLNVVPRVSNLDAQDWLNRVYLVGGTVSPGTAATVNNFCNTIDNAGIRDRFYRLNLFCGDNLTACLVPLYRGPSLGGTQFGNTTDTNVNFAATDYVETGSAAGLTGNGSNKYLRPGLLWNNIVNGGQQVHFSTYLMTASTGRPLSFYWLHSTDTQQRFLYEIESANTGVLGSPGIGGSVSGAVPHLLTVSRTSSSSATFYRNDVAGTTRTENIVNDPKPIAWFVFARNLNSGSPPTTADVPVIYDACRLSGYSIGLGMTAGQVASYNSAMQNFQAALRRAVT